MQCFPVKWCSKEQSNPRRCGIPLSGTHRYRVQFRVTLKQTQAESL